MFCFVVLVVSLVKRLLMLGVSADSTNDDGLTALHQVSEVLERTDLKLDQLINQ